jgi:hypothetical protein
LKRRATEIEIRIFYVRLVGTRRRPYWEKRSKDREKLDCGLGERRERERKKILCERR